jgi:hypothetical protein
MGLAENQPVHASRRYKEKHSIKDLPEVIKGIIINISGIANSPFSRAILDNGFSVMLVPGTDQIKKGDTLKITPDTRPVHLDDSREIKITRNKKFAGKICISECQIIPDKKWDETAQLLIEQSKQMESQKHQDWWEKYYESQKPKEEFNPNWLEDLKKAASLGIINGDLD